MRLFVCEFITGGGMRSQELSPPLLSDANLMIDALMDDLRELDGFNLITTRDNRLAVKPESVAEISDEEQARQVWHQCMQEADLVWFIAPETDGALLEIRELADRAGCRFIGCEPEAIRTAAGKKRCADYLSRAGIQTVPTEYVTNRLPESRSGWVIKPDDGAGCEETFLFRDRSQIEAWKRNEPDPGRFVIQPHITGIPASISAVYYHGQCRLLSCNLQHVRFVEGTARHEGTTVNGLPAEKARLRKLAESVGRALRGLEGYVGIDVICTEAGPILVEINPRLTTSYAGLRKSLNMNVAEIVLRDLGILEAVTDEIVEGHCLPVALVNGHV
jgi:predicted ATP-grasp superfamily ATP-dependent carboligase